MRPLLALCVLLGGCVTARTTVTYEDQKPATFQDIAVDASINTVLTAASEQLDALPAVPTTLASKFVAADAAQAAVQGFQLRLLNELSGPQYAGIRPDLQDAMMSNRWARRLPVEQLPSGPATSAASVDDTFQQILGFVRALTQRPDKRVSFSVVSEPKEATFSICPQYVTSQCASLTTDGDVASLLRGYYTYTLALAGYKPVKVDIDLVPFAKSRLRCILRREDDPRGPGPCTPE
jgi:hypothetical protein